ncbi:MAG: hypothetical protein FRX49_00207 [Trebouxia sp. A1-2]|nr:MAG: hypothetical protein FRX49_00207 [Trebouxia sp. A1-2]
MFWMLDTTAAERLCNKNARLAQGAERVQHIAHKLYQGSTAVAIGVLWGVPRRRADEVQMYIALIDIVQRAEWWPPSELGKSYRSQQGLTAADHLEQGCPSAEGLLCMKKHVIRIQVPGVNQVKGTMTVNAL